jgi:hypothetical protein
MIRKTNEAEMRMKVAGSHQLKRATPTAGAKI